MNIDGGKSVFLSVINGDYPSSFNWSLHPKAGAPKEGYTQRRGHPRKGTPRDGSTQGRLHLEVGTPKKGCTQRQELIHNGENMDPSTELLPRFIIFSVFAWKDKTSFGSFAPKLSFASRHHEF